jgi:hypothetical protein
MGSAATADDEQEIRNVLLAGVKLVIVLVVGLVVLPLVAVLLLIPMTAGLWSIIFTLPVYVGAIVFSTSVGIDVAVVSLIVWTAFAGYQLLKKIPRSLRR